MNIKAKLWFFTIDATVDFPEPVDEKTAVSDIMKRFDSMGIMVDSVKKPVKKKGPFADPNAEQ